MKDDELCYLYKGGAFNFEEAKKYCEVEEYLPPARLHGSVLFSDTILVNWLLL